MIFMHKESGELCLLLLMTVNQEDFIFNDPDGDSMKTFGVGKFTLYSPNLKSTQGLIIDLPFEFELIGML